MKGGEKKWEKTKEEAEIQPRDREKNLRQNLQNPQRVNPQRVNPQRVNKGLMGEG